MIHLGDLDLATRWLAAEAEALWPQQLALLERRRHAGAAHLAATGTPLVGAGDGSLGSAVLVDGFPPLFRPQETLYLLALAALAFHLSRAGSI